MCSVVAIGVAKTESQVDLGDDLVANINALLAVYQRDGKTAVLTFVDGNAMLNNV